MTAESMTAPDMSWDGWVRKYTLTLSQIPTVIATLRDATVRFSAAPTDNVRVSGSRDQPIPLRWDAMTDADRLWSMLVWYGSVVAQRLGGTSPAVLRAAWTNEHGDVLLRAGVDPVEAATEAQTITTWLIDNYEHTAMLGDTSLESMETELIHEVRKLLGRWRITPNRLRTHPTRCQLCGERAVHIEWVMNRQGDVDQSEQCTRCGQRYDPGTPRLGELVCEWPPREAG